jgi:mannan endo-1,4-beta-mannosidase
MRRPGLRWILAAVAGAIVAVAAAAALPWSSGQDDAGATATRAPGRGHGRFTVGPGGRILDPRGRTFVPVGVNANGPNWVWPGATVGQSAKMARWHFNTLRINTCITRCGTNPRSRTNNDLRRLVAEYTAKRYVVIIAQHQYGAATLAGRAELAHLRGWWRRTAARYRNNPYVWFDPLNEPTGHGSDADPGLAAWWRISTSIADVIHRAAPRSVIVFDGNGYGQDKGTWACSHAPGWGKAPHFWLERSAGVVYGRALQRRYGVDRVVISPHVYGQWAGNREWGCAGPAHDPYRYWRQDLNLYLDRLRQLGLPVVVGEYGSTNTAAEEGWSQTGAWEAAHILMEQVAPRRVPKVGVEFWHGSCCDTHPLTEPDADWSAWSGDPAQLTWQGRDLYRYARLVNPGR